MTPHNGVADHTSSEASDEMDRPDEQVNASPLILIAGQPPVAESLLRLSLKFVQIRGKWRMGAPYTTLCGLLKQPDKQKPARTQT